MQMTLRARIYDLIPILLVFAFVSAFATFVLIEYVARQPVQVPAPQVTPAGEMPGSTHPYDG